MILRHTRMHVAFKGEYIGLKEMRKHIAWYTAGLPHSSSIRRECNMLETEEELVELLKQHGMLDKESAFKYNIQNVWPQVSDFVSDCGFSCKNNCSAHARGSVNKEGNECHGR